MILMKISIIVPVYNVESFLVKCLDSCIQQTYPDIEIIAVNDGSTDNSGLILDEYAKKTDKLRVFHQHNQGVAAARRNAIELATGSWLMFLDSDDYLPVNAVEVLYNIAISNNAEISAGSFIRLYDDKRHILKNSLPYGYSRKGIIYALLASNLSPSLWGKLFSRKLFEGVKTDSELRIGEDAYITMQLYDKTEDIVITDIPVYFYVDRSSSVTNNPSREAVFSRLLYIENVIRLYADKNYFDYDLLQTYLNIFIMNELTAYLVTGGDYRFLDSDLKDRLTRICLKDKTACKKIPGKRLLILRISKMFPFGSIILKYIFYIWKKIKRIVL
jgi:glycosyltransferase involved in cell wall biosynthesis